MSQATVVQRGSEQASDKTAIHPFHVNVPETELTELRRRINATKWPERETVTDASQGVQLATIQALARCIEMMGHSFPRRECVIGYMGAGGCLTPVPVSGMAHFLLSCEERYRSDLKPARTSSEKSFGCSHAAKCPPLLTLL